MARVKRLVTFADVGPQANDDTMSVLARLELELTDGTRVLLLKNRGWVGSGPPGGWGGLGRRACGRGRRSKRLWTRRV